MRSCHLFDSSWYAVTAGPKYARIALASGGVGNLQRLVEGVTQGHTCIVLTASIFHFGEASIADAHAAFRAAALAARSTGN